MSKVSRSVGRSAKNVSIVKEMYLMSFWHWYSSTVLADRPADCNEATMSIIRSRRNPVKGFKLNLSIEFFEFHYFNQYPFVCRF